MKSKNLIYLLCISLFCSFCWKASAKSAQKVNKKPVSVIFETDMGNDVDDALALDMLYKYMKEGKINLLAISTNKQNIYSAQYLDIMNTWYGYPGIPIGVVQNGVDCENDGKNYPQYVAELKLNGKPAFIRSISDYSKLPESVSLYRKILAKQPNHSVVIISTGFSTNLARLLESKADKYSSLSGKDLVAKKVRLVSVMAGNFTREDALEYNIVKDIPAAKKLFSECPSPIVLNPFEVGVQIKYPATSIENDFKWTACHPVVEGYKYYSQMPYDKETWDLCAVLYAVEPKENYFAVLEPGKVEVTDKGYTSFTKQKNGNCTCLSVSPEQVKRIKAHFIQLISFDHRNIKVK